MVQTQAETPRVIRYRSWASTANAVCIVVLAIGCGSSANTMSAGDGSAKQKQDASSAKCPDGGCSSYAVCVKDIKPTFDSINAGVFAKSCGTDGNACHSTVGGDESGGLHLAGDAYTALLGSDGQGAGGGNIAGSARGLKRVVPGDPDHSFLVIKLSTHDKADPMYGAGMP